MLQFFVLFQASSILVSFKLCLFILAASENKAKDESAVPRVIIVAIVLGSILFVIIKLMIITCCIKQRKENRRREEKKHGM